MLTVSEAAGGAELHLKKRQSGTADSLAQAKPLAQETAALFRGCLRENVLESWHKRLYEENKQACAKHTFFQDLFYFPKTDCCQSSDTHIHTHYIYPKQSVSTFGMLEPASSE